MIKDVAHIGITVSDMDKSIKFYTDILKLKYSGELLMQGEETDLLFGLKNCKVRVAYLNANDNITAPPIELIQFLNSNAKNNKASLTKASISEVCFMVDNIDDMYNYLIQNNIECLSPPQTFDFTKYGFGKSKAIYFKDPDGIILELMQNL